MKESLNKIRNRKVEYQLLRVVWGSRSNRMVLSMMRSGKLFKSKAKGK